VAVVAEVVVEPSQVLVVVIALEFVVVAFDLAVMVHNLFIFQI
jgi:hypothetical protein